MSDNVAISENAQLSSKKLVESGMLVIELMRLKTQMAEYERRITQLESNQQEKLVSSSEDDKKNEFNRISKEKKDDKKNEIYVVVGEKSGLNEDCLVYEQEVFTADFKSIKEKQRELSNDYPKCGPYRIARLVFLDEEK